MLTDIWAEDFIVTQGQLSWGWYMGIRLSGDSGATFVGMAYGQRLSGDSGLRSNFCWDDIWAEDFLVTQEQILL